MVYVFLYILFAFNLFVYKKRIDKKVLWYPQRGSGVVSIHWFIINNLIRLSKSSTIHRFHQTYSTISLHDANSEQPNTN